MPEKIQINTYGEFEHRKGTIEDAQDVFDESSYTKAVLAACEHADWDARNKQKALEYLAEHVAGKHVEEVAEILSTRHLPVEYDATVHVGDREN